jgi:hypothetical protein
VHSHIADLEFAAELEPSQYAAPLQLLRAEAEAQPEARAFWRQRPPHTMITDDPWHVDKRAVHMHDGRSYSLSCHGRARAAERHTPDCRGRQRGSGVGHQQLISTDGLHRCAGK